MGHEVDRACMAAGRVIQYKRLEFDVVSLNTILLKGFPAAREPFLLFIYKI
nr:MAG TPA: hypothetical protein [Bacteriophage sp.]